MKEHNKYVPSEIINSGISGMYHLGPTSHNHRKFVPLALTLRNVYTYVTRSTEGKVLNWGVKKSYVSRETGTFEVCGIRAWSNMNQPASFRDHTICFWHSNFARFHTHRTHDSSHTALYYQFSLLRHDAEKVGDEWLEAIDRLYDFWSDLFACATTKRICKFESPQEWLDSRNFSDHQGEFYKRIYSSKFEENIATLASTATSDEVYGMVKLDCNCDERGDLKRPSEGTFHAYLPNPYTGKQVYQNLESPEMIKARSATGRKRFRQTFYNYEWLFRRAKRNDDCMQEFPRSRSLYDGMQTRNPRFIRDVEAAIEGLTEHFSRISRIEDDEAKRPYNCLILGAPGAGKTFVAKKIARNVAPPTNSRLKRIQYMGTFNLSHAATSDDVDVVFNKIANHASEKKLANVGRIYFFDEFDVTVTGTSIIRYLIDYIFEGNIEGRFFGDAAFIFSGGTLESRTTLSLLQNNASDFDLSRFLLECSIEEGDWGVANQVREQLSALAAMSGFKTLTDRGADALTYLQRLEKLRDFLSRINGFILELPDISNPLSVTNDRLLVRHEEGGTLGCGLGGVSNTDLCTSLCAGSATLDLLEFVLALEQKFPEIFIEDPPASARSGDDLRFPFVIAESNVARHVLEYKNMLLCERFSRVLMEAEKRLGFLLDRINRDAVQVLFDKEHLNFLCTVPLTHGSRGLGFIVSKLRLFDRLGEMQAEEDRLPDGRYHLRVPLEMFYDETFRMHIGDCSFGDIKRWWARMFRGSVDLSDVRLAVDDGDRLVRYEG